MGPRESRASRRQGRSVVADVTSSPDGGGEAAEASLADPEITIVTITKDDPSGIRMTLSSVDNQDFGRLEHVVVDGGSDPDVAGWLISWRDRAPERRTVISNPPPGIYPAMNLGIRSTSAPLVLMLNGGDKLAPGALRQVSEHHHLHRWRWAYGAIVDMDPQGQLRDEYTFTPFSSRLFRSGLRTVPHPSTYVARSLYDELGLYNEHVGNGADQEFLLRASLLVPPAEIPSVLSMFLTGGVSSQENFVERELYWHRMRLTSGTAFGPAGVDLLVTAGLLVRLLIVRGFELLRRVIFSRGRVWKAAP